MGLLTKGILQTWLTASADMMGLSAQVLRAALRFEVLNLGFHDLMRHLCLEERVNL
jgi:hypothetical protein